ncbi:NAD(P)/FAD-dependent oxidoreductase [Cytobacillus firmus]|uniref:Ferredoxin--NADP reductase n=1 Tax=Cytobacillus firmus TaxID=1399 RepID=A0AA46PW13_CYTFI|nr:MULTISPECIES: NAD(P)/FAD-dependent oxidoreductase [Bacillaceae]KML38793.1 ferredoxin-NADP reductase [Cytobacillus firmus]MBG9446908.1 ferredoxin-NADP reductase [Cytobacillus firmus]MBG9452411.1 ferredoxin-NADP reductase [Cytobacillus firmus]MBY6052393.1 NAD(P)/FAD-dependent oxidoreductase [Cytobacillus firmus]MCC3648788.1 NAD(P)/FAD-dependent oxidoreductase [Cytobacillus oceanisediminis]
MKEDQKVYDITIIGGGPTGLFTAFYGGMRQASVKIIESLPQLGGQLSALYPEKYIYDVAGFPKVRAQELIDNLKEQMAKFEPTVSLEQSVEKLEKQADGTFKLTTNKEVHYSKTIIITAGNGAFQPRRLELESAVQYEGKNLHYFIDDLNKFAGKKVVVFGGGDSAVDWALMLEPIAEKVTIVHRRDKFRAHEHSVENLQNSKVEIKTPYVPAELIGDSEAISQVVLEGVTSKEKEVFDVDAVIVNYGFVSSLGPIKEWGLDIEKNSIVVNSRMETNIEGIYAAGDICTYDGKVKLIACGFGEAPTAVNHAKSYIDPKAKVQPMHSSSMFGK